MAQRSCATEIWVMAAAEHGCTSARTTFFAGLLVVSCSLSTDTVNDDGDYDSDDVVESSWCTAKRRLRFFVDPAASSAKGGKSKAAADAKTGAGAAASSSVSDFVQTEMLVCATTTTCVCVCVDKHRLLLRCYTLVGCLLFAPL